MTIRRVGWVALALTMAVAPALAYDAKDKRDPLVALVTPEGVLREPRSAGPKRTMSGSASDLALQGILYDPQGKSSALINGELFQVGDRQEDFEIVKIESSRVVVLKNGTEHELKLPVPDNELVDEGGT